MEEQQAEGDPARPAERGDAGAGVSPPRRPTPGARMPTAGSRARSPPIELLRPEQIEQIHESALTPLRDQGVKVLLGEARDVFRAGDAIVYDETELVHFGPELVEHALATAPERFELVGRSPERTVTIGGRSVVNVPVSSPPAVSDLDGGKRPGNLADFRDLVRLTQAFDVLQVAGPCVEPQDVPLPVRHYATCHAYLTLTDKAPYVYARGRGQVADGFEMFRIGYGDRPRDVRIRPPLVHGHQHQLPAPARHPDVHGDHRLRPRRAALDLTPFTLAGAMAPVSLAGALTLQHAEALAGVVLAQLARPGAPVVYGAFTSNVDMRSGAPAFGTPEYFKAALAGGQLARRVGLPYRTSAPNASNAVDAQAMYETMMSLFGAVLGGGNVIIHAAGWLEGGLTASKEKLILDVEVLQMVAEAFQPLVVDDAEIALDAIAEHGPGRPLLRRRAHAGALPDGLLHAARLGLVELRPVDRGRRARRHDARQRGLEARPRRLGASADRRRDRRRAGRVRRPTHGRGRRAAQSARTGLLSPTVRTALISRRPREPARAGGGARRARPRGRRADRVPRRRPAGRAGAGRLPGAPHRSCGADRDRQRRRVRTRPGDGGGLVRARDGEAARRPCLDARSAERRAGGRGRRVAFALELASGTASGCSPSTPRRARTTRSCSRPRPTRTSARR